MRPNGDEVRFKFSDPIGELNQLKKLVFVLQLGGANPQRIGDQPAKTAERNRREREHRRRVFERRDARQTERRTIAVQRPLRE